ncbi:MAG TPA: hypothetical protein VK171_06495, partial [Fimbriimonas sp.]|nr:hypothetical protein [Fimbriimonas sp.]
MNAQQQKEFAILIGKFDRAELRKLYKTASALRKRHKYKEGERRLSLDDIVYDLLQNQPPEADDV